MSYANLPLLVGNYCTIYIDGREIEGQIEKLGPVVCTVSTDEGPATVTTRELEEWCEAPIGSTRLLLNAEAFSTLSGVRSVLEVLQASLVKSEEDADKSREARETIDSFSRGIDAGVVIGLRLAVNAIERAVSK